MTIDEYERKIISELEEMRCNYCREVEQLEEIHSHLRERCSKLLEINDNRHVGVLLDLTVDGIRNIEEALHKLHEAIEGVKKLILLLQAYSEVKF